MSKKTFMAAITISLVLVSLLTGMQVVNAQTYQTITITSDGSVTPDTTLLERNGTTYTFEGNIFGSIEIQTGYITIDGAGYTLQGRKIVDERGLYLVGPDRSYAICSGVLVKNLKISNFFEGIYVVGSSNNSMLGNVLDNAGIHLISGAGLTGDLIKYNTFNNSGIFVDYNHGGLDVITENNFFNSGVFVDLSDAPIVDRNYWSNYTAKYPNAKQLSNSDTWDTPYVDDSVTGTNASIDYHPLILPMNEGLLSFSNPTFTPAPSLQTQSPATSQSSFPSPSPTKQPIAIVTPPPTGFPPTGMEATILTAVLIAVVLILISFREYRKKRGTAQTK